MEDCAFCQIAAGELDAHRLYEDDLTVAFLDEDPATRGHLLVAPKTHHEFLFGEDESASAAVFRTVHRLSRALQRTLEPDGVSIFYTSAGLVGTVTHSHVHLVPRYVDDDIHLALDRQPFDHDVADRLAVRIRANV